MAFSQAWQLAAVMCWTILPITLFGHFGIKILVRESINEGVAYAKGDSVVLEALASIRTVSHMFLLDSSRIVFDCGYVMPKLFCSFPG